MASFTSLPTELQSKIIEEIVLSTTEEMAKKVNPYSESSFSVVVACREKLFPLATVSGTFMMHLIDASWLYGLKLVVKGPAHVDDQVSILQFIHYYLRSRAENIGHITGSTTQSWKLG